MVNAPHAIKCSNCFFTIGYISEEVKDYQASIRCPKCEESFGFHVTLGKPSYNWGTVGKKYDLEKIAGYLDWEMPKEK